MSKQPKKSKTEHGNLIVLNKNIDQIFEQEFGEERYRNYRKMWRNATNNLKHNKKFPVQLDFELNYSCNLRCPMCTWSAEVTKKNDPVFDFKDFKKIINEGLAKGLQSVRLNYVNEPLIRPDLSDFIRYCRDKGVIDVMLSSNAALLQNKEQCSKLIKSGLTKIQFSIDAFTPETYAKMRVGTTLQKVIKAIDLFLQVKKELKTKFPLVRVNFVKSDKNAHELDNFIEYWKNKDVDLIAIQDYMLLDVKTQHGAQVVNFDKNKSKKLDKKYLAFRCASPFRGLTIRNSGDILPCCTFYGAELVIGNIKTNKNIQEIWQSKKIQALRNLHLQDKYYQNNTCKRCVESHSHLTDQ